MANMGCETQGSITRHVHCQGGTLRRRVSNFSELAEWEISIYYSELKQKCPVHSLSWTIFSAILKTPSWLDGGQFCSAMWSVFELDGSRTSMQSLAWDGTASLIQSSVGDILTASYRLVDTIKEEQAPTELTAVQLEAGSHDTQTKEMYSCQ